MDAAQGTREYTVHLAIQAVLMTLARPWGSSLLYLENTMPAGNLAVISLCVLGLVLTLSGLHFSVLQAVEVTTIQTLIEQYAADEKTLDNRFQIPLDQAANRTRALVLDEWRKKLHAIEFANLDRVNQIDYLLLRTEIDYMIEKRQLDTVRDNEAAALLPYAQPLIEFCKRREDVEPIEPRQLADILSTVSGQVDKQLESILPLDPLDASPQANQRRLRALRAAELIQALDSSLREADQFYTGYDPLYSWWVRQPMQELRERLDRHRLALREKVVALSDADRQKIVGLPIGAEGLKLELQHEWIAHAPAELVALAEREMAWCEEQMLVASDQLGFGNDWRAAVEHVKQKHVQPGQQPALIRELAWEAMRFLESHDLITVPPLAANGWRMNMMSPERQRVNPYFLGGDSIIVSFPTDAMSHEDKVMSMRSNNEHFARATVHHELIPGHHLQYYMLARYRPYRRIFSTPFWIEGWALYWEMLLWDLDFAHEPEDRVGMLFWRKHRCARIIFSLRYHLGTMTPEACVDYLVERVGHERAAAEAEVRRSIMGGYGPLYQAAYMLGGLQLRSLHSELVQGGRMTNREFHDSVLHEHSIPIELLRSYLMDVPLTAESRPSWRFADD
jgi:uncharacterized protein (DUF885 family)